MEGFQAKLFHQKRVHAHRPGWARMLERRFTISPWRENGRGGYVSLLQMDKVRAPLVKLINGERVTIIGDGYSWLQYYLTGQDFSAVATFDPVGTLVQWYVDVISKMGVDERGWPWYDDLYLDVVATGGGWVEVIDGDDLDKALQNGAINEKLHNQAWKTARRIEGELQERCFWLDNRAEKDRQNLLAEVPNLSGSW